MVSLPSRDYRARETRERRNQSESFGMQSASQRFVFMSLDYSVQKFWPTAVGCPWVSEIVSTTRLAPHKYIHL